MLLLCGSQDLGGKENRATIVPFPLSPSLLIRKLQVVSGGRTCICQGKKLMGELVLDSVLGVLIRIKSVSMSYQICVISVILHTS